MNKGNTRESLMKRKVLNKKFAELIFTPEKKNKKLGTLSLNGLQNCSLKKIESLKSEVRGIEKAQSIALSPKGLDGDSNLYSGGFDFQPLTITEKKKLFQETFLKSTDSQKKYLGITGKMIWNKSENSLKSFSESRANYYSPSPEYQDFMMQTPQIKTKGFKGYKFSTLNTNRNLVKSNMIRRIFY
jgi:hypothetical protein